MRRTYELFESRLGSMSATRVTLQAVNQPGLNLVALSGKSPLGSRLHQSIQDFTAPYSVRVDVDASDGSNIRVNVDRHGNVWWYQSAESRIAAPLGLLDALADADTLRQTRSLPLDRAAEEDDAP
ncbi:MAG TPA: hypothetical protein VN108_00060 [Marmoricola sp.]|nr:hypothetical protein [Marmoricola sp.]